MSGTQEAVAVVAEVIEDVAAGAAAKSDAKPESELRIIKAEPGSAIECNAANLKAWIDSRISDLSAPGAIKDGMDYGQVAAQLGSVRRIVKDVDDERKRLKKKYLAPYEAFEREVKAVIEPAKRLDDDMKMSLDSYRSAMLREHYETFAPMLVPSVPYERIHEGKWLDHKAKEDTVISSLESKVSVIASKYERLRLKKLVHRDACEAKFFEDFSIDDAEAYDEELTRRERAAAVLRERREAMEAQAAAKPPTQRETMPESAPVVCEVDYYAPTHEVESAEPVQDVFETVHPEVTFTFRDVTDAQVDGIIAYCKAQGIKGRRHAL